MESCRTTGAMPAAQVIRLTWPCVCYIKLHLKASCKLHVEGPNVSPNAQCKRLMWTLNVIVSHSKSISVCSLRRARNQAAREGLVLSSGIRPKYIQYTHPVLNTSNIHISSSWLTEHTSNTLLEQAAELGRAISLTVNLVGLSQLAYCFLTTFSFDFLMTFSFTFSLTPAPASDAADTPSLSLSTP